MADEPQKTPRASVGERLKAMFKAAEKLPLPDKLRDAAESEDATATPKQRRRKSSS